MLRETESAEWSKGYQKYMKDLGCPIINKRNEEIEWLLTYAIRLEYADEGKNFKKNLFVLPQNSRSFCLYCAFENSKLNELTCKLLIWFINMELFFDNVLYNFTLVIIRN
jgi:RNA transcription, translation and transport factor protein